MKILLSAYSCEPGKGSEPGVGWNAVRQAARFHDVWVFTHDEGRQSINAIVAGGKPSKCPIRFLLDLPSVGSLLEGGGGEDNNSTTSSGNSLPISPAAGCTARSASMSFTMLRSPSTVRQAFWHCCRFHSYGVPSEEVSQHLPPFGGLSASGGRSSRYCEALPESWASTIRSSDEPLGRLRLVWRRPKRPPDKCECWVANRYRYILKQACLKRKSVACRRFPPARAASFD